VGIEYRKEGASYCVYVHRRATDNVPYYVGISGNRFRPYDLESRTQLHKNITNKYGACIEIVAEGLTMMEAINIETELIKTIGRICDKSGPLANFKVNHFDTYQRKSVTKTDTKRKNRRKMKRKQAKPKQRSNKRLQSFKRKLSRNSPTKRSTTRKLSS
jgi:predicted RNA-binding protein with RPS1 domain